MSTHPASTPPAGTNRDEEDQRRAMIAEATRIEHWARVWDLTYRQRAHRWSVANSVLSVVASLLAASAGATGLGKVWGSSLGPGLLALAAAGVAGVTSALGASKRATDYLNAAVSNSGLADAARIFLLITVCDQRIDDVTREFLALCKRRDAIVSSSPITGDPIRVRRKQLTGQPPTPADSGPYRIVGTVGSWLLMRERGTHRQPTIGD